MPSSISRPTLRVFSHSVSCFSVILRIVNVLLHLSQHVRRDVLPHILSVDREHPELATSTPQVIDDPQPAALAATLRTPAQLSHAARTWHDDTRVWLFVQIILELGLLVVFQVARKRLCEKGRFDKLEHAHMLRQ